MPVRRTAVLVGAVAVLLGLVMLFRSSSDTRETAPRPPAAVTGKAGEPARAPGTTAPHPAAPTSQAPGERAPRNLDPRARAALLRTLEAARNQRLASEKREPARPDEARDTTLNIANKTGSSSDWEERQLQMLRELLGECFDLAAAQEPGLAGTFGLRFSLAAEPEVGGLVDGVSVMEEYSSIEQATMRECMLESIYALELDPPPEGVRIDREITLRFDDES